MLQRNSRRTTISTLLPVSFRLLLVLLLTLILLVPAVRAQQAEINLLENKLAKATEDTARVNLLNALSSACYRSDIQAAERHASAALTLAESVGYREGIARACNCAGVVAFQRGKYQKAMNLYMRGLKISEEVGDVSVQGRSLNGIGLIHQNQGRLKKALQHFEKSLLLREQAGDKRGTASCLLNIGNIHMWKGNWAKAREHFQKNLEIRKELRDSSGLAAAYGSLGIILSREGANAAAVEQLSRSVQIADNIGDQYTSAIGTTNIGLILGEQGEPARALEHHKKSLSAFRALGTKRSIALCLMNIGVTSQKLNLYSQALDHFLESITLMQELGDKSGIAACQKNIAVIYEKQGSLDKSLMHVQESMKLYKDLGERQNVAACLNMMGETQRMQRNYPKALELLKESLAISEDLGDKKWIAQSSTMIGRIYSDMGEYRQALPYLERGLTLKEELGEMAEVAANLCLIGWYYHLIGDNAAAQSHLERGLQIAGDTHEPEKIDCALARLHKLSAAMGQFEKAYAYSRSQIKHRDTTRNEDARMQLQELMQKYEAEQREREIKMLEKDKAYQFLELERRNEELRRHHAEALQRKQQIDLLSREADIQQLEVAMTAEQLRAKEAEGARKQQTIDLLEKDQKLKAATLDRETTLRNALIAGAALLVVIGLLVFRRMRDKRRTIELKALVAEAHAQTADMEKLRVRAEAERKEREAQQRFSRELLDAQEAERKRLAGELHDSLGQDLIVVKNRLLLLRETANVNGDLDAAITGVGETLEDVRRLSRDLRPYQLDRYGIGKALHAIIARADESSRVQLSAQIEAAEGMWSKDSEVCIYRIVQEGLSNILKHADAENAAIRLLPSNGGFMLLIEDDGKGFDSEYPHDGLSARSGFGLKSMAERAEILGGHMSIHTQPGKGTRIEILLPQPTQDSNPLPPANVQQALA